jgi:hypothetical protein
MVPVLDSIRSVGTINPSNIKVVPGIHTEGLLVTAGFWWGKEWYWGMNPGPQTCRPLPHEP